MHRKYIQLLKLQIGELIRGMVKIFFFIILLCSIYLFAICVQLFNELLVWIP